MSGSQYKRQLNHLLILLFPALFFCGDALAQSDFKGLLLNNADSTPVLYAAVHLAETDKTIPTDEKGEFVFSIPEGLKKLTFTVTAIGCKTTITYQRTFNTPEKVYVDLIPGSLNEVVVTGKITPAVSGPSAQEVMVKAIEAIPDNYMDDSYFSLSLYRQYQQVNNVFMNLVEAQPIVMFKVSGSKKKITAKESYATTALRRSRFMPNPDNAYECNLSYLMRENPIYHLAESALNPHNFSDYTFSYDTTSGPDYIINYTCKDYSSEGHGIDNYKSMSFHGESWETGQLVIDKKSYAIKKIRRSSYRYPGYKYPNNNNVLQPARRYYVEFIIGELVSEYVLFEGKWYLKRLVHQYTNEFFSFNSKHRDYFVTDCFEWNASSISKDMSVNLGMDFYTTMPNGKYRYDRNRWANITTPFYFFKKEAIYSDLERNGPIETQFNNEGGARE